MGKGTIIIKTTGPGQQARASGDLLTEFILEGEFI
jgi:hypothetical protein